MKKAIKILTTIAIILITFFIIFTVLSAIYFASWEDGKINNLNIYYNKVTKFCLAGEFEWDGDTENMTFTVPDEYEGLKISSLGGSVGRGVPVLFCVIVPDSLHPEVVSCTEIEECVGVVNEDTVTYSFTVKLGKNIKTFKRFTYKEYFMDANDNVIYIVETKYECSEDNKYAYTENGKLYNKRTNQLVY